MTTEQNKLTMNRFNEVINTASEQLATELISADAIFHVPAASRDKIEQKYVPSPR